MPHYRIHKRLNCDEFGQLHLRDSFYPVRIENISPGGALVYNFCTLPDLHVGDNVRMTLKRKITFHFNCEVIRIETSYVALSFIDIDISDAFDYL